MSDDTSNTGETKITDDEDVPVFTWFYDGVGIDDGTGDAVFALLKGIEALEEAFGLRGGSYALPPFRPYIVASSLAEASTVAFVAQLDAHTPRIGESLDSYEQRRRATCLRLNPPVVFLV